MVNLIYRYEGLNWNMDLFRHSKQRRRNVTGWNMSGMLKSYGRAILIDGSMCI